MAKINLKSPKLLLILILLVILVLYVLYALIPKPPTVTPPGVIVTPPPATPTLAFPILVSPSARPRLNIIWEVTPPQFPSELPYYQNLSPLVTKDFVKEFASRLGFTDADLNKETLPTTLLYIKNTKSLTSSLKDYQLTYTDTNIPKASGGWPNQTIFTQNALKKVSDLLNTPLLNLTAQSDIIYLRGGDFYLEPSSPAKSQLAKITFSQTIGGYPYVTTSTNSSLITAVFDQKYNLYFLEIMGGTTSFKVIQTKPVINYVKLQQIAPSSAQIISSTNLIETDNAIANSASLDLIVKQVKIGYFQLPTSDILHPVFLLKGVVKGTNVPSTPATYMVPALQQ